MDAVLEVKVMVFWAARETRLTSMPKRLGRRRRAAGGTLGRVERPVLRGQQEVGESTNTAGG